MIAAIVAHLVGFARRHAARHALAIGLLTIVAGWYAAGHLSINTDVEAMLPRDLPWRQSEIALDRAFPENADLLAIVIDGQTADLADRAAQRLAERLAAEPQFTAVRRPDGGPFFDQNGLLFLPVERLEKTSTQLIAAQPLIGSLAHDPSLRGLFDTLKLFIDNSGSGDLSIDKLNPTLAALAEAIDGAARGQVRGVAWQQLLTGAVPSGRELRRFVLAKPVLDYSALEPGATATSAVRREAQQLGLEPQAGVRVRITGPVALNDDQFATLKQGALRSTLLSLGSVCLILFFALRSLRLVAAILATIAVGLVLTGAFAALTIGSLNILSVACGVLFIGLAVDFSIQFSIRYRDQRYRRGGLDRALDTAARTIGPSLVLAAAATAIGFFSFVPTPYHGVRELGWIAGAGMIIAILLNFSLLPALLKLLRPGSEEEPVGFVGAAPLDRFLATGRGWVIGIAAVLALGSLALMPQVSFDFDPLDLKDPNSESMETVLDLIGNPDTTPYTAEILAPSLAEGDALADRLEKLPEVAQVITASSLIPQDQDKKLAIIDDLGLLVGPSLAPTTVLPPPSDAEIVQSLTACRNSLRTFAADKPASPAGKLATALNNALDAGPKLFPILREVVLAGLLHRIDTLARLIEAKPVTLADLPADLRASWLSADGEARVEVFPKGNGRDPAVLERFVAAVRQIAPAATGTPVTIQESGRLISGAFVEAGIIAVALIVVLLAVVLRRPRDVALVVAPLLLAALLSLAITVLTGMRLNYANIIALPLLLGIGVAFDIYFVMNWRAGLSDHLQSSTARAVVFSALTTMTAFGSLALSPDPGSAEMGKLLAISLAATVLCTLFVLPALLGPSPLAPRLPERRQRRRRSSSQRDPAEPDEQA